MTDDTDTPPLVAVPTPCAVVTCLDTDGDEFTTCTCAIYDLPTDAITNGRIDKHALERRDDCEYTPIRQP